MIDSIIGIIKQTVEYQNWGLNPLTFGALGALVFVGFQSWGVHKQVEKIRNEGETSKEKSVLSVHWFGYTAGFMLACLPYGIYMKSALIVLAASVFFTFNIRLLRSIYLLCGFTKKEIRGLFAYCFMLPLMIFLPWMNTMYLVFSIGAVVAVATQPLKMFAEKSAGVVEIRMLVASLTANMFWIVYAFAIEAHALMILNPIVVVIMAWTIFLWMKYRPSNS